MCEKVAVEPASTKEKRRLLMRLVAFSPDELGERHAHNYVVLRLNQRRPVRQSSGDFVQYGGFI